MFVFSGINAVITNHFKMPVRNMDNKFFNEINSGNFFDNQLIILMSVVFKSNKNTIIFEYARSSNNRSTEIATDIFSGLMSIAFCFLSINIESVGTVFVYI